MHNHGNTTMYGLAVKVKGTFSTENTDIHIANIIEIPSIRNVNIT